MHRPHRAGQAVVRGPGEFLRLGAGQRGVGGDDGERGVQRRRRFRGRARPRRRRRARPASGGTGPPAGAPDPAAGRPRNSPHSAPLSGSATEPAALTTTSAATVIPDGSTALADPHPALEPAGHRARAGADAALRDRCARPRASAASTAARPSAASGRARQSPPRPRSKTHAAGHHRHHLRRIGADPHAAALLLQPGHHPGRRVQSVRAAARSGRRRRSAAPGCAGRARRSPGCPGRRPARRRPRRAPPSGARTTVVPVSQPSPARCACPTRSPATSVSALTGRAPPRLVVHRTARLLRTSQSAPGVGSGLQPRTGRRVLARLQQVGGRRRRSAGRGCRRPRRPCRRSRSGPARCAWPRRRARFLSLLLTTVHGACSVSVSRNMASLASV